MPHRAPDGRDRGLSPGFALGHLVRHHDGVVDQEPQTDHHPVHGHLVEGLAMESNVKAVRETTIGNAALTTSPRRQPIIRKTTAPTTRTPSSMFRRSSSKRSFV